MLDVGLLQSPQGKLHVMGFLLRNCTFRMMLQIIQLTLIAMNFCWLTSPLDLFLQGKNNLPLLNIGFVKH
jgi:hypothetical protein